MVQSHAPNATRTMTPDLHHTPGRLRVRIPAVKRQAARAAAVQRHLARLRGVHAVAVRSVTGSITVHYDADALTMPEILDHLSAGGYLAPAPVPRDSTAVPAPAPATSANGQSQAEQVARVVAGVAVEKVLERSAAALIGALV